MKAHLGSGGNYICIAQLVKNPTAIQETWVQSLGWENPLEKGKASSVQLLSWVQLFVIPWTTAHQASPSITDSRSLPKLMSIESVVPSNHLILCRSLLLLPSIFPSIRVLSNKSALASGGQSVAVSASASVLPMSIWDWLPLELTGLIFLLSKGLRRVFSSTTVPKHQNARGNTPWRRNCYGCWRS